LKKGSSKNLRDPNLQSLESSIIEKIGLKVFIKNTKKNSGAITIEYKDLDQLNKIVKILKSNY
jgi:ParB family chromosome partitioning protein